MIYKDYKISKRYTNASEDLLSGWKKYLGMFSELKLTKNKIDKMDKVVRCFIYNLCKFKTNTMEDMDVCLNRTNYAKPLIYNGVVVNRKVSYDYARMFIDFLVATGKATLVKGECYSEWDGGTSAFSRERSKLVFSDLMLQWVADVGITREALDNCVFIRVHGVDVEVPENDDLTTATSLMKNYNILASKTEVVMEDKEYAVKAIKVFNETTEKGGRIYLVDSNGDLVKRPIKAGVELSGECFVGRLGMKINGVPVVEIDYSANHPRICYTKLGIDIGDFDPYGVTLDGCDPKALREVAKFALLCLLNADNEKTAILALNKHIGSSQTIKKAKEDGLLPQRIPVRDVIQSVYERNEGISEFFFQESWGWLQRVESLMLEYVIDLMMQNDQFIIPIHDSILCREDQLDFAKKAMYDAYESVMGSADNCRLKVLRKEDFMCN